MVNLIELKHAMPRYAKVRKMLYITTERSINTQTNSHCIKFIFSIFSSDRL